MNSIDLDYSEDTECKFCYLYNNDQVRNISDIILYESKYFFIIPALGCLVNNYIVLISKRHIFSMCYLTTEERTELANLLNKIRTMYKEKYGLSPIIFEHGASEKDANRSSCCVLHAHIHIAPYQIKCQTEMIRSLGLSRIADFSEYYRSGANKPYVFFMDNVGKMYFRDCSKDALPSQIVRKWIAKDIGESEKWDWRKHPFNDKIELTVSELKPLIRNSLLQNDCRIKYVYYCCAMDGLSVDDIEDEYNYIQSELEKQGKVLVNPFEKNTHNCLTLNKHNSELIVNENKKGILKADCVIINLTRKDHLYIGCIAEMVYAKESGCYVIVISGESGADKHFHTLYHADRIVCNLNDLLSESNWRNMN